MGSVLPDLERDFVGGGDVKRDYKPSYILIDGEGVIRNIFVADDYEAANYVARCGYGDDAIALEYRYLVQIGDIYEDGVFYNVDGHGNREAAQYIPSDEERINDLMGISNDLKEENGEIKRANNELTIAMADMIGGAL